MRSVGSSGHEFWVFGVPGKVGEGGRMMVLGGVSKLHRRGVRSVDELSIWLHGSMDIKDLS